MLTGALVAAGLVACSPGASDPDNPAAGTTSASSPPTTPPPITRPLDASTYRARICDVFTDEEAQARGFTKPGQIYAESFPDDDFHFTACGRPSLKDQGPALDIAYYYDSDLLERIYRRQHRWGRESFAVLTIAGQPAARTDFANIPDHCEVAVGLTVGQSINVRVLFAEKPCDQAVEIAEIIVRKLG